MAIRVPKAYEIIRNFKLLRAIRENGLPRRISYEILLAMTAFSQCLQKGKLWIQQKNRPALASRFSVLALPIFPVSTRIVLPFKSMPVGRKGAPPVAESSDRCGWAGTCFCANNVQRKCLVPTRNISAAVASLIKRRTGSLS